MSDAIAPALLSQIELADYIRALECPVVYVSPLKDIEVSKLQARNAIVGHIDALWAKLSDGFKQYTCSDHREEVQKGGPCVWCALAEARELERERCANIAERHAGFCSNTEGQAAAEAIAAAIRKGGET